MLIAQAVSAAPSVHANSLYHEWGLVAAILGICVVTFSGLWWLLRLDPQSTTESGLRVRSVLAGMFQHTIVQGAVRIFDLIDNHLPYALSQAETTNPKPSAFDRLCEKMKELGPVEENRDGLRKTLEKHLKGMLIDEVRKLLGVAEATASGEPSTYPNPTVLRVTLEGDNERRLGFIAQKTVVSNKMEKGFHTSRWSSFCCLACAVACGILVSPWVFVDYEWAFVVAVIFLALFGIASLTGIACLLRLYRCQSWLESTASRYKSPEDWFGELSHYRVK